MGLADEVFLAALEAGTLPPVEFGHRGHLKAGFLYLKRHDFPGACVAMKATLKSFAAAQGKMNVYHETVTVAYLALVAERLVEERPEIDFDHFLERYPELLSQEFFERYYPRGVLDDPGSKATFMLPRPRD